MASQIMDKRFTAGQRKNYKVHMERYESAKAVVEDCQKRQRTSTRFHDMKHHDISKSWEGVSSYEEALQLMETGYQPTVEKLKQNLRATMAGEGKRISFRNDIVGYAPIVPLAMKGVPQCMMNATMKPIKAKIIDIYWDMTASCGTDPDDIIEAGSELLATVISLEKQGYRFNLYGVQSYTDREDADMLVVKVKDARQPIDLKRISFPLTHTAFFRVIGFDWYSKVPGGRYRSSYGSGMAYHLGTEELVDMGHQLFGQNAIYFSCAKVIGKDKEHFENVIKSASQKPSKERK